jgi:hypothetical protein
VKSHFYVTQSVHLILNGCEDQYEWYEHSWLSIQISHYYTSTRHYCKFSWTPNNKDVGVINKYWNWHFPELCLETNWSFKANNLLCQLENDTLHHHKQSHLIFLTHNMHVSFIPCNYLNLNCIILIPNIIIILMHHRSKILLKIKNLPYWNWLTELSGSGKSKQRNVTQNSGSNKHSCCPDWQLMSKQHKNRLWESWTIHSCNCTNLHPICHDREPHAYYLNSKPTLICIITYLQAWLNVLHNEFNTNYMITLNSEM